MTDTTTPAFRTAEALHEAVAAMTAAAGFGPTLGRAGGLHDGAYLWSSNGGDDSWIRIAPTSDPRDLPRITITVCQPVAINATFKVQDPGEYAAAAAGAWAALEAIEANS